MGRPLINNRTLTQLTQAAVGPKPDESAATFERLLTAAASEGVTLPLMLFGLDGFTQKREQPPGLRKAVGVLLEILLQQTPDDVYIDCPAPNEFLAILPSAPLEPVERIAEEIRRRYAAAMRHVKSPHSLPMTLSGSVALFPQDGETRRTLLRRMRCELLRLREEGGNRVRRSGALDLKQVEISLSAPLVRRMQSLSESQGESLELLLEEAVHGV